MRVLKWTLAATSAISIFAASNAFAATELAWWHAMTGANNETVERLAKEFNESQSEYKIVPVFKGTYGETLNAGIAAFRSKQAPAILQVFDAGSGVMLGAEGAVVPVAEVLKKGGYEFNKDQYLPGIVAYYSKADGTMLSFPFNSSSPILYFNKDAFTKAGIDTAKPPATWPEVFEAAKKIKASGAANCGFTSTWLTWIQTENFSAWNNVPYGTNENGLAGLEVELKIDAPLFVDHFQSIADLAKDGTFRYGGRTSEAKQLFMSGECAILTESSVASATSSSRASTTVSASFPTMRAMARRTPSRVAQASGSSPARAMANTRAWPSSSISSRKRKPRPSFTRFRATCRSRLQPMRKPRSPASMKRTRAARRRSSR